MAFTRHLNRFDLTTRFMGNPTTPPRLDRPPALQYSLRLSLNLSPVVGFCVGHLPLDLHVRVGLLLEFEEFQECRDVVVMAPVEFHPARQMRFDDS